MKSYCVLAIQKIKTIGGMQRRYEHNFRLEEVPNADIFSCEEENEELVNFTGMNYRDLWYKRIRDIELETGKSVSIRKNSVLALELVTTFSRDAEVDIDEWKTANVKWMQDTFGVDNVLSMQLHRDEEGCEHIHTIVIPIDDRKKLCAKSFTGGRTKMFELHNSYGKAMAPLGLARGEMYSRAKKQDLRRFYGAVNEAVESKVPEMMEDEMVDNYIARVNDYLQTIKLAHLKEKNDMQREIDMAMTKNVQMQRNYAYAIALQDEIARSFDGNKAQINKRLEEYRAMEVALPRKTLATLLHNIKEKFPIMESIRNFRKENNKKKKQTEVDIQ